MTHQHEILPLESIATTGSPRPEVAADEPVPSEPLVIPITLEPVSAANAEHEPADQALEHWKSIQGKFVDDPHGSLADARALIDDLMQRVLRNFEEHRASLDRQWSSEKTPSTEELRLCLQHYRALFTRLLPIVSTAQAASAELHR